MKKDGILIVVVAAIVGVGGFVAGMKYQESKTPTFGAGMYANRQNGTTRNFGGNSRSGMNAVNGSIISSDDSSITVKLPDGSSKIVLINDKTMISKADQASTSDLKSGEKIAAFGTTNSDGSVTAQTIQLNPIMRGGPGGINGQGAQATPSAH